MANFTWNFKSVEHDFPSGRPKFPLLGCLRNPPLKETGYRTPKPSKYVGPSCFIKSWILQFEEKSCFLIHILRIHKHTEIAEYHCKTFPKQEYFQMLTFPQKKLSQILLILENVLVFLKYVKKIINNDNSKYTS